jgi:hypothetical protein
MCRLAWLVLLSLGGATSARGEPSRWFGSASIGLQHTDVATGGGAHKASGERFALAARFAPHPVVSLVALAAVSLYHDNHVHDPVTQGRYAIDVTDYWLGGRVLLYPAPRLWVGAGLSAVAEREGTSLSNKRDWLFARAPELIAGGQILRTRAIGVQLEATWGRYDRFYGLEHIELWTLGAGVEY